MRKLLLTLFFIIVITPLSIIFKLLGMDMLDLKWEKNKKSYWKKRDTEEYSNEDYTNQL